MQQCLVPCAIKQPDSLQQLKKHFFFFSTKHKEEEFVRVQCAKCKSMHNLSDSACKWITTSM